MDGAIEYILLCFESFLLQCLNLLDFGFIGSRLIRLGCLQVFYFLVKSYFLLI